MEGISFSCVKVFRGGLVFCGFQKGQNFDERYTTIYICWFLLVEEKLI